MKMEWHPIWISDDLNIATDCVEMPILNQFQLTNDINLLALFNFFVNKTNG